MAGRLLSPGAMGGPAPVVNAISIDVEDYFQVSAFENTVPRSAWDGFESRVCRNTDRLLEIFDEHSVTATFFVLGWVADEIPPSGAADRRVGSRTGVSRISPSAGLRHETERVSRRYRRSKAVLKAISGQFVGGYRAPSYSITERSLWALDVLVEEGFTYDAEVSFPFTTIATGFRTRPAIRCT